MHQLLIIIFDDEQVTQTKMGASIGQLNETQLSKLLNSWEFILQNSPDTGNYFYRELFSLAPELRVLFKSGIIVQSEKFLSTVKIILAKAYKGNSLLADVQYLATRHTDYGVTQEHYDIVGKALLSALAYGLKDKWNDEIKTLWITLYNALADAMISVSAKSPNSLNNKVA